MRWGERDAINSCPRPGPEASYPPWVLEALPCLRCLQLLPSSTVLPPVLLSEGPRQVLVRTTLHLPHLTCPHCSQAEAAESQTPPIRSLYLVGLGEATEEGKEHGGGCGLGIFSKVLHHRLVGLLQVQPNKALLAGAPWSLSMLCAPLGYHISVLPHRMVHYCSSRRLCLWPHPSRSLLQLHPPHQGFSGWCSASLQLT